MPKVRTTKTKPPKGYELIEPTLNELALKMREAENEPHEGKRKAEGVWPRSRFIYELFYRKKEISRELYEWCLNEGIADKNLIAKWKKPGYEKVCCLICVQTRDHNFATTCVCRVPKAKLESGKIVECVHCGCKGCASGD